MLEGSCLCGGIRYEVSGKLGPIANCHCGQCRKASGTSFATHASVAGDPGTRPAAHFFASEKAPWTEIADDLPQHL